MKGTVGIFLAIIFLLSLCAPSFSSEIAAESRISKVTIYPGSVMVSRTADIKLEGGEHKVVFGGIIPEIDEDSIKVSASGNADARLFGAKVIREFLTEMPAEKTKQLMEAIQQKEDEISSLENLKRVLQDDKNFLDSIKLFSQGQLPKDLVTKFPAAGELDATLKFIDARYKENYALGLDYEIKGRELNKKLEALRNELSQVSGYGRKVKNSIIVELETTRPGSLELVVSYLIGNASWQPIYDARANFENNEVELVSYGIVSQTTGEEWSDVGIVLSTAKPSIGGRMPEVTPWFLRPYQPVYDKSHGYDRNAMVMRKAVVAKEGAMLSTAGMRQDYAEEEAKAVEKYAKAEEKGIAVNYTLPRKATIKTDGAENKLPVSTQKLVARFEYSAYPRAAASAYLGSKVTNAKDLQLLGGRVNIFFDNDYVGSSSIDNIAPGEEFDLSLGADENVKVKREVVDKKVDQTIIGNIPSPNRRTIYNYKITIENYKSKKIKMNLFEAMPVPEDDRIKVKVENVSLEPNKKDWKDKKGVWEWEMALNPKEKKEVTYTLDIEHPRDMVIEGL